MRPDLTLARRVVPPQPPFDILKSLPLFFRQYIHPQRSIRILIPIWSNYHKVNQKNFHTPAPAAKPIPPHLRPARSLLARRLTELSSRQPPGNQNCFISLICLITV
jgi:hypothetical protein